jgi:hypothetical protein
MASSFRIYFLFSKQTEKDGQRSSCVCLEHFSNPQIVKVQAEKYDNKANLLLTDQLIL